MTKMSALILIATVYLATAASSAASPRAAAFHPVTYAARSHFWFVTLKLNARHGFHGEHVMTGVMTASNGAHKLNYVVEDDTMTVATTVIDNIMIFGHMYADQNFVTLMGAFSLTHICYPDCAGSQSMSATVLQRNESAIPYKGFPLGLGIPVWTNETFVRES